MGLAKKLISPELDGKKMLHMQHKNLPSYEEAAGAQQPLDFG